MANCGIKRYDNSPSRVRWIDVDMNRWVLSCYLHPKKVWSLPVFGKVLRFVMVPSQSQERTLKMMTATAMR